MRPEFKERSGYRHREIGFTARLGRGIREYSPTIILGALLGAGLGGFAIGAASLDQLFNPQLIEVMRNHTEWYQYFTTNHAITPFILDHSRELIASGTVLGAAAGGAITRFLSF